MKIGVYGGAFAPLHNGHVSAAIAAYDALRLDLLYIIPTKIPPHKDIESDRAASRFSMTEAVFSDSAIIGERNIAVSPIEFERDAPSYTSDTLRELRDEGTLFLIVGSDSFLALESWHEGGRILREINIAVVARRSDPKDRRTIEETALYYDRQYSSAVYIIDAPAVEISSTVIRDMIASGKDISALVPTAVAREIAYERLWGDTTLSALRDAVRIHYGDKRYAHVVSTADECVRIAEALSLPSIVVKRVYVAGLLHDLTRNYSVKEHKKCARESGIALSPDDLDTPNVLHQTTGALTAARLFPALCDASVMSAIACHTTGRAGMSVSDMILFLADYIEPLREHKICKKARKRFWNAARSGPFSRKPDRQKTLSALRAETLRCLQKTSEHMREKGESINARTAEAIIDIEGKG